MGFWDQTFNGVEDDLYRVRQEEQAAQAMAEIMNEYANQQEGMELPPGIELNPLAQQQQTAGRAGIQAVLSNPNMKRLGRAGVSSALTPFLGMINKPVEYAGREWDKRQTQQENQALRAQNAQDLQAQKAQDRMNEIEARKTFISEIQNLVSTGQMTQEDGQRAIMVKYGLQPRATMPSATAEFEAYQRMSPEQKQEYDKFKNSKQQFIVDNRRDPSQQPPSSVKEFERAQRDPAYAAFLDKFRSQPGMAKPATRADKRGAEAFQNTMMKDHRNYDLTQEELDQAIQTGRVNVAGKRLKPEAIERINTMREEAGLTPLSETTEDVNTYTSFLGAKVPFSGGQEKRYRYPTQGAPAAPQAQAQPKQQAMPQTMNRMPTASEAGDRPFRDTVTGKRYRYINGKRTEIK